MAKTRSNTRPEAENRDASKKVYHDLATTRAMLREAVSTRAKYYKFALAIYSRCGRFVRSLPPDMAREDLPGQVFDKVWAGEVRLIAREQSPDGSMSEFTFSEALANVGRGQCFNAVMAAVRPRKHEGKVRGNWQGALSEDATVPTRNWTQGEAEIFRQLHKLLEGIDCSREDKDACAFILSVCATEEIKLTVNRIESMLECTRSHAARILEIIRIQVAPHYRD